ncbi:MAG: hypothetical protein J0H12_04990 [Candidatus Paracaedimonas acanthamoebae]|uniref:Uncharacterized protein n=1 Tax=Candidatus Paracaedimonas acanthamoebae TaxID=244581 RepID=A0A8J7TTD0_9PROT|nr:hypothetical protein [Candidatus Paracaedimonas acanthamoebae]
MSNYNLLTVFFVKLLITTSLFSSDVSMEYTCDPSASDAGKNVPSPRTLVASNSYEEYLPPLDLRKEIGFLRRPDDEREPRRGIVRDIPAIRSLELINLQAYHQIQLKPERDVTELDNSFMPFPIVNCDTTKEKYLYEQQEKRNKFYSEDVNKRESFKPLSHPNILEKGEFDIIKGPRRDPEEWVLSSIIELKILISRMESWISRVKEEKEIKEKILAEYEEGKKKNKSLGIWSYEAWKNWHDNYGFDGGRYRSLYQKYAFEIFLRKEKDQQDPLEIIQQEDGTFEKLRTNLKNLMSVYQGGEIIVYEKNKKIKKVVPGLLKEYHSYHKQIQELDLKLIKVGLLTSAEIVQDSTIKDPSKQVSLPSVFYVMGQKSGRWLVQELGGWIEQDSTKWLEQESGEWREGASSEWMAQEVMPFDMAKVYEFIKESYKKFEERIFIIGLGQKQMSVLQDDLLLKFPTFFVNFGPVRKTTVTWGLSLKPMDILTLMKEKDASEQDLSSTIGLSQIELDALKEQYESKAEEVKREFKTPDLSFENLRKILEKRQENQESIEGKEGFGFFGMEEDEELFSSEEEQKTYLEFLQSEEPQKPNADLFISFMNLREKKSQQQKAHNELIKSLVQLRKEHMKESIQAQFQSTLQELPSEGLQRIKVVVNDDMLKKWTLQEVFSILQEVYKPDQYVNPSIDWEIISSRNEIMLCLGLEKQLIDIPLEEKGEISNVRDIFQD